MIFTLTPPEFDAMRQAHKGFCNYCGTVTDHVADTDDNHACRCCGRMAVFSVLDLHSTGHVIIVGGPIPLCLES